MNAGLLKPQQLRMQGAPHFREMDKEPGPEHLSISKKSSKKKLIK